MPPVPPPPCDKNEIHVDATIWPDILRLPVGSTGYLSITFNVTCTYRVGLLDIQNIFLRNPNATNMLVTYKGYAKEAGGHATASVEITPTQLSSEDLFLRFTITVTDYGVTYQIEKEIPIQVQTWLEAEGDYKGVILFVIGLSIAIIGMLLVIVTNPRREDAKSHAKEYGMEK